MSYDTEPTRRPQIDWQPGEENIEIQVGHRNGKVMVRFPLGPVDGLALTPTDARRLAHSLRMRADRAQKDR